MKNLLSCCLVCAYAVLMSVGMFACSEKADDCVKIEYDNYISYTNLSYGTHERHEIDLCLPKNKTGKIGMIFMIHGGGWVAGDKSGYATDLVNWCEQQGYVAAAINYRYASESIHVDELLDDISASLVKIKEVAKEYEIDVDKMLLTGGSAGGHLSLLYAYSRAEEAAINPAAVVSFCGPTDLNDENFFLEDSNLGAVLEMAWKISGERFTRETVSHAVEALAHASPISYVSNSSVPTVICHGTIDDLVPYSNATILKNKLDVYGVENVLVPYQNSGHGLENDPTAAATANNLMSDYALRFLD
ncbi:MAG: alpha/beta hydrolase [Clostridia bacterium]|nr:alpha/beta hydrolase [Clostridia bacterium]